MIRIGDDELGGIRFAEDGLVHTAVPQGRKRFGRKDVWYDKTYDHADVCLTCERPDCTGEAECFRQRKKELEEKRKHDGIPLPPVP